MSLETEKRPENLKELYENEEFLNLLTNSLKNADIIMDDKNATLQKVEEDLVNNKGKIASYSKIKCEKLSLRRLREKIREFEQLIENLQSFLRIVLETFALHDDEPPLSFLARNVALKGPLLPSPHSGRDAQVLFTVKRVVQSLSSDPIDGPTIALKITSANRLCIAGRALSRLIKCFTMRLSILDVSSLPHLFQFSIVVHDLLRQFLEYCVRQTFLTGYTKELEKLIDYFQIEIVFGLKEKRNMLLFLLQQKMEKFLTSSEDQGKKKSKPFVYLRPTSTPKGYLMPLHLREKRRKLQRKISQRLPDQISKRNQTTLAPEDVATASDLEHKNRYKLTIPDRTVTEAKAYASAMRNKSEINRLLFGLPIGTSTAHFTEKFTQDLIDEILDDFERDLSLACEDIVDKMYEIETKRLQLS